ncbi:MAG: radical SAM-associated putative lipoprotein [Dysgonomonas sp.]
MKLKAYILYSKIISSLLLLLGFTSCDSEGGGGGSIAEYGTPSAKFIVKGTLVDKTDNTTAIGGMKVAIGYPHTDGAGIKKTYYVDSIVTNNTGGFSLSIRDFPTSRKFVMKYEDTDAAQNGNYGLTTDTVRFENPSFTGGKEGWYVGETIKDLGKVNLSPVTDEK